MDDSWIAGLALASLLVLALGSGAFDDPSKRSADSGLTLNQPTTAPGDPAIPITTRTEGTRIAEGTTPSVTHPTLPTGARGNDSGAGNPPNTTTRATSTPSSTTGSSGDGEVPELPELLLMGVVLLPGVAVLYYFISDGENETSDDRDDAPLWEEDRRSPDEPRDSTSVRGEATPPVDFENRVASLWSSFADGVPGVDRETATPGKIQRAAIDAGDPPDAVRTLTATFNDVRYGEVDPARHRATASSALREIAEQDAAAAAGRPTDEQPGDDTDDKLDRNEEKEAGRR